MKTLFYIVIALALLSAGYLAYRGYSATQRNLADEPVACTAEAKLCPDGSAVGRTGPNCEFAPCPELPEEDEVMKRVQNDLEAQAEQIVLAEPRPLTYVESPFTVTGMARGHWFSEGSFEVVLTDWDGRIIGESVATADGDIKEDAFVPFSAEISFTMPDNPISQNASLILHRSNPSGLPEHDDALEIPLYIGEEVLEQV